MQDGLSEHLHPVLLLRANDLVLGATLGAVICGSLRAVRCRCAPYITSAAGGHDQEREGVPRFHRRHSLQRAATSNIMKTPPTPAAHGLSDMVAVGSPKARNRFAEKVLSKIRTLAKAMAVIT